MNLGRVAFLIGAGLSQPYGVPTMKPFYDRFRAHVARHFPSCLPALRFSEVQESAADLEAVISGLQSLIQTRYTLAKLGTKDEEMPAEVRVSEQAYGYLSAFVVDTCERFDQTKAQVELGPLIHLMSTHSCWCFTTNYDRIVEVVASSRDIPISDGFDTAPESTVGRWSNSFAADGLRLAKLHGSVTWYEEEQGTTQVRLDRGYALPAAEYRLVRGDRSLRPLMIIPTLEKDLGRPPYAHLVARMLDALTRTRLLIIIGSSLRDTHLRSYLQDRQREFGIHVLVIDPAIDSLKSQYGVNLQFSGIPAGISELSTFGMSRLSELVRDANNIEDADALRRAVNLFVESAGDVSALAGAVSQSEPEAQFAAKVLANHSTPISDRTRAVAILGRFHHPVSTRVLIAAARGDPAPQVRTAAVGPLMRLGTPDAIDTVRNLALSDQNESVRLEALLGIVSDASTVDKLHLIQAIQQSADRTGALHQIAERLTDGYAAEF